MLEPAREDVVVRGGMIVSSVGRLLPQKPWCRLMTEVERICSRPPLTLLALNQAYLTGSPRSSGIPDGP